MREVRSIMTRPSTPSPIADLSLGRSSPMSNGTFSNPFSGTNRARRAKRAGRRESREEWFRRSFGCCERGLHGRTYHGIIHPTKHAIAGFKDGAHRGRSRRSMPCWPIRTRDAAAQAMSRALTTGVTYAAKKGDLRRKVPSGQRHKNHGACRQRWLADRHQHREWLTT